MAKVIPRGDKWQAQVNKVDPRTGKMVRRARTFPKKSQADEWATKESASIIKGDSVDIKEVAKIQLQTWIQKYMDEVTPRKSGAKAETNRLKEWLRHDWAERGINKLHQSEIADFVQAERKRISRNKMPVSEQTIKHKLNALSNVYEYAKSMGVEVDNPVKKVGKMSKPGGSKSKVTRILPALQPKLIEDLQTLADKEVWIATELGIETGVRQGELLRLTPADVLLTGKHPSVVATDFQFKQNNIIANRRNVPLTPRAVELFEMLKLPKDKKETIFKVRGNYLTKMVSAACKRIEGLESSTYHSCRHEFASRMARVLPQHVLQKIMGHKSPTMTAIYYNPTPEELAEDMAKAVALINALNAPKKKPAPKKTLKKATASK